jgi:hypothetical protein
MATQIDPDAFEALFVEKMLETAMSLSSAPRERRERVLEHIRKSALDGFQKGGLTDLEAFFRSDALMTQLEAMVERQAASKERARGARRKL